MCIHLCCICMCLVSQVLYYVVMFFSISSQRFLRASQECTIINSIVININLSIIISIISSIIRSSRWQDYLQHLVVEIPAGVAGTVKAPLSGSLCLQVYHLCIMYVCLYYIYCIMYYVCLQVVYLCIMYVLCVFMYVCLYLLEASAFKYGSCCLIYERLYVVAFIKRAPAEGVPKQIP